MLKSFHVGVGRLDVFFGETPVRVLGSFSSWAVLRVGGVRELSCSPWSDAWSQRGLARVPGARRRSVFTTPALFCHIRDTCQTSRRGDFPLYFLLKDATFHWPVGDGQRGRPGPRLRCVLVGATCPRAPQRPRRASHGHTCGRRGRLPHGSPSPRPPSGSVELGLCPEVADSPGNEVVLTAAAQLLRRRMPGEEPPGLGLGHCCWCGFPRDPTRLLTEVGPRQPSPRAHGPALSPQPRDAWPLASCPRGQDMGTGRRGPGQASVRPSGSGSGLRSQVPACLPLSRGNVQFEYVSPGTSRPYPVFPSSSESLAGRSLTTHVSRGGGPR